MKKITFILAIFLFGAMAYAQDDVLLWNGEGEGLATSVNNWSEDFTVATVSNPVPEGLNTSDNVLSFPAHWFTSEWGDFGGYLCIRGIGAENLGIYTYLTYKFLVIQDDVTTGNSIQTRLKFENGTTDPIDTDQLYTQELTNDGGNEWQQIFIEIPEDVVTTDHVDLCIITSTIDGSDANNHDVEVEMYYDDIGFGHA